MDRVMQSDEELANRCAGGDCAAFDALVVRHFDALFRFVSLMFPTPCEADEALGEALARAAERMRSIPHDLTARAWLYKMVVETCHGFSSTYASAADSTEGREASPGPARADLAANVGALTCDEVQARISEHLDGELVARDASEIDRHLRSCAACARCRHQLRAIVEALHAHASASAQLEPGSLCAHEA